MIKSGKLNRNSQRHIIKQISMGTSILPWIFKYLCPFFDNQIRREGFIYHHLLLHVTKEVLFGRTALEFRENI